ncbi:MAG: anthranilate phosphoribosyltransferase [bacterium]|nr:anthranilate phosphoribosyltransferase [bacterium]
MQLRQALQTVLAGTTLTRAEAEDTFANALCEDIDPILFGGLLTALAQRGETASEIAGAAAALRGKVLRFEHDYPDAIDTCGTGGDGLGTFNLSTASAIVAAAAGARVVKHGNRSVSSKCGSADLLEAAGVELELAPAGARAVLDEVGITFLFAPLYHPAMRFAAPVRKALGVRTVFNFLGPICNPGFVRRQLLGVGDGSRVDDFTDVLRELGHERSLVVHGAGGADELTLEGENRFGLVGEGLPAGALDAAGLGLERAPVSALAGGEAGDNLALLGQVLAGEAGALRDATLLNAGAALFIAGVTDDVAGGVARAGEAIDSGAARDKLAAWSAATRAHKGLRS